MKESIIQWIKDWFDTQSNGAEGIVIGISGGKDSTVVAKLCVEAIGKERVFGVLMPNGEQKDIADSKRVCELLDIDYVIVNINTSYLSIIDNIISEYSHDFSSERKTKLDSKNRIMDISEGAMINIAPRVRMTTLYAIAQTKNYRVAGTGNATERVLGYFTKWGDGACDFNPLGFLTCTEVIRLGLDLGLPEELINKTPSDGLSGKTDEEHFGYSYKEIDEVLLDKIDNGEIYEFIQKSYDKNEHKLQPVKMYETDEIYQSNSK